MKKAIQSFVWGAVLMLSLQAGASAQTTTIGTGATLEIGSFNPGANAITLGTSGTNGNVSTMPMSLNYGLVGVNVSFTGEQGAAAVTGSNDEWNPSTTDFFRTDWNNSGQVNFEFTKTQRFFGMQWGSPDVGNTVQFYNGARLIATATSADMEGLGVEFTPAGAYAEFKFSDLGFDRVVAFSAEARGEFSNVTFSEDINPAPIPIGGLGGLLACLGMLGARRQGMAGLFASLNANSFRKMRLSAA